MVGLCLLQGRELFHLRRVVLPRQRHHALLKLHRRIKIARILGLGDELAQRGQLILRRKRRVVEKSDRVRIASDRLQDF